MKTGPVGRSVMPPSRRSSRHATGTRTARCCPSDLCTIAAVNQDVAAVDGDGFARQADDALHAQGAAFMGIAEDDGAPASGLHQAVDPERIAALQRAEDLGPRAAAVGAGCSAAVGHGVGGNVGGVAAVGAQRAVVGAFAVRAPLSWPTPPAAPAAPLLPTSLARGPGDEEAHGGTCDKWHGAAEVAHRLFHCFFTTKTRRTQRQRKKKGKEGNANSR